MAISRILIVSTRMAPSKIYAYVDETWLDSLFIVAVVIADLQRELLTTKCENIEDELGRHKKWSRSADALNLAYTRRVLVEADLLARCCFLIRPQVEDVTKTTVEAIARAIEARQLGDDYKATILYDCLPKNMEGEIGSLLRKRFVRIRKVRGIDEEDDALMRLADALCGLVRDAYSGKTEARDLMESAIHRGILRKV